MDYATWATSAGVVQNPRHPVLMAAMRIDPATVRRLREQRAWSQDQLAEVAGLSARTVQRVETGKGASLETRMALAAALGVDAAALCEGGEPPAEAPAAIPEDRAFRTSVVAIGLALVFILSLLVGFLVGRDIAAKDARADCIAAGRSHCGPRG